MKWEIVLPLIGSVFLAIIGYFFTYFYNLHLAKRKDLLERINNQLRDFYGPLLSLTQTSCSAWKEFRQKYRPEGSFWGKQPYPTEEEALAWRIWMIEVFMPINLRLEKIITERADLIVETFMPSSLLMVCAHVAAYKPVFKAWENNDFSINTSLINFPAAELMQYAEMRFKQLKEKQAKLLGVI